MAGAEPQHRDWIKLWIKESLIGTIREELTPEERSIWWDFLLLAGNSRVPGTICANENTPIPVKRMAGILNSPEPLIQRCIKKFELSGRIEVDLNGLIRIVNWAKYQYSDYDRVKKYRAAQKETPVPEPTLKYDFTRPPAPKSDGLTPEQKQELSDKLQAQLADKLTLKRQDKKKKN